MGGLKIWLSNAGYGLVMNALCNRRLSPHSIRRNFNLAAATSRERLIRRFPQARFSDVAIGHLRAETICAMPEPERVMLYLHGGGYVFGSIETYRSRALKLSYRCRAEVLIPDYRLAPEHPFPAALDDARSAWQYLTSRGDPRSIVVAGDSAGGGLTLALLAALRDDGGSLPAGAVALSPWTDLALTGASVAENRRRDRWLTRDQLLGWAALYAGDAPATHPLISPLHADPRGLPPLLLLAGADEIIVDDTRRFAAKARSAGVRVQEVIAAGMQHDWPLTLPWLEASRDAWRTIEEFVTAVAPAAKIAQAPASSDSATSP